MIGLTVLASVLVSAIIELLLLFEGKGQGPKIWQTPESIYHQKETKVLRSGVEMY